MSKYEDYSEVSKVYDKERTAMGADTIAGLLHVYGGKPLKVNEPRHEKTNVLVSDLVRHKPGCTTTEDG